MRVVYRLARRASASSGDFFARLTFDFVMRVAGNALSPIATFQ